MSGRRVDYTGAGATFRRSRTVPPEVAAQWGDAVRSLALPPTRVVLDLGSGTGGFSALLQSWLSAAVIAVEPSGAMRTEARSAGSVGDLLLAGAAEAIPLRTSAVDVAWLSTVVHQFDDLDVAAREVARVVRDGGHVLVRGFFSDVPVSGALASFPGHERAAGTFPSTATVTSSFVRAGFAAAQHQDVPETWRFDRATWAERIRRMHTIDSALRPLTDDEIEHGITNVLAASDDQTIRSVTTLRLLVLRRR